MIVFPDILAIGALVFALATWVFIPIRLALAKKRKGSLATVGLMIATLLANACISAVGLILAVLTLVFSERTPWGWLALAAIATFWLIFATVLVVGDYRKRRRERANTL
jgi:hypothetical protein